MKRRGFTLIELLIVVAIIAILAAIAVPNFLEAQTRAKVTRAKADMRTLTTAVESYRVDWNRYPPDCYARPSGRTPSYDPIDCTAPWYANSSVTSPIAYLTSAASLVDPFNVQDGEFNNFRYVNFEYTYMYVLGGTGAFGTAFQNYANIYGTWKMTSDGPDKVFSQGGTSGLVNSQGQPLLYNQNVQYDPTNGTVSLGDIIRSQKFPDTPIY